MSLSPAIAFHDWQPDGCAANNPGSVTEDVIAGMGDYLKLGEVERVIAFRNETWY